MKCGMAWLIHNKDEYKSYKKKIVTLIKKLNREADFVFNAAVVEFREEYYLIIDGFYSITTPEDDFAKKLAKLICPEYKKNPERAENMYHILKLVEGLKEYENLLKQHPEALEEEDISEEAKMARDLYEEWKPMLEQFDFSIEKVKREVFYVGEMYSEESPWVYKMFHIESEKELLKELSDDIFKATVERKDIGNVKFIETLYDVREEEDR